MIYLITFLLVLFLVWWFVMRGKGKQQTKSNKLIHGKFHCITIHHDKHACDSVKRLSHQRVLSGEAPVLPLISCDAAQCNCRFEHHEDRRFEDRRGVYNKAMDELVSSTLEMKKRSGKDRRQA